MVSCGANEKNSTNTYYVSSVHGGDNNSGLSMDQPLKSLSKISELLLNPGDSILLAAGETFEGSILLEDINGAKGKPIVVSSYPTSNRDTKAHIHAKGHLNGVSIKNCSFLELRNLSITASHGQNDEVINGKTMRCGVLINLSKPGVFEHLYLSGLSIHDVFYEAPGFERPTGEIRTANGTQNYGWGIRVINNIDDAYLKDIRIEACVVENVAHTGIKLTSRREKKDYGITELQVSGNQVLRVGGPGIQMSGVQNGHIFGNEVDRSGSPDDSRKWGRGSGLWTWGSDRVLIENNRFTNANGPGDSAGAHIDFNCSNVVMQYNFSANNAGGFAEILGNNYNCAYRYNISVNDGHRVKGVDGAFQEGKFFWLSGFCKGERRGPYNSYFYNNTIYVKAAIQAKIAIDRVANGVLIANNIFHVEGDAKVVKGDQYNPETAGEWKVSEVIFENNLFLHEESWPSEQRLQDKSPRYADVQFSNPGGMSLEDYIPQNAKLVSDQGIRINKLSKDSIGLVYGLQLSKDIMGNPIVGKPDMGAIELVD